ncbi:MAG: DUF2484 family protein [Sulfitobacter sp.]
MTPLFWIAVTWVLATAAVARLPLHQRFLSGALLLMAAVPILISIGLQVGWVMALLGFAAVLSLFPNPLRLIRVRYQGDPVQIDANVLRYMVVPGEL